MSDTVTGTARPVAMGHSVELSVVVPLYNEEENIGPALEELLGVLSGMDLTSEVILVDDGSRDRTGELAAGWSRRDSRIVSLHFRRNFGQTAAIQAGFDRANGRVVVVMDGDQQNDPADIPLLLATMDDGHDVVSGWRRDRKDRALSRKLPSKIANRLISRITGTQLHDYGCTLKAYDAEVVRHLHLYGELHRFIPALASMSGARVIEVPVNHRARTRGTSKYGLSRAPRVVLDLVTVKFLLRYLMAPMQFFGKFGLLSFVAGAAVLAVLVGEKVLGGASLANRPLLEFAGLAVLLGALFFCTGLLGEVLTRIYHEVGDRKSYVLLGGSETPFTEAPGPQTPVAPPSGAGSGHAWESTHTPALLRNGVEAAAPPSAAGA